LGANGGLTYSLREKYSTVKIPEALIPRIDRIINNSKDSFGLRKFRSRTEFVTEAVKRLLEEFEQEGKQGGS